MDANVILSAVIGGKAGRVFAEAKGVEFVTTAGVLKGKRVYTRPGPEEGIRPAGDGSGALLAGPDGCPRGDIF